MCVLILHLLSAWPAHGAESIPRETVLAYALNTMHPEPRIRERAIEQLQGLGDPRISPFFVDLLRLQAIQPAKLESALRKQTGRRDLAGWLEWSQWLAFQEIPEHPAYREFKRELFALVDPLYRTLLDPSRPAAVRSWELVCGEPERQEFVPLTLPRRYPADPSISPQPDDEVVGVIVEGRAVAYPLSVLEWHGVVNDVIGDVAVAVTYCPTSRTVAVYRSDPGGKTRQFAASGLICRNNMVLYDVQDFNLWQQFSGRAIVGPAASQALALQAIAHTSVPWRTWQRSCKAASLYTEILDLDTGFYRPYGKGSPEWAAQDTSRVRFPVPPVARALVPRAEIFGTWSNGRAKVYPVNELRKKNVANDSLGDINLVVVFDPDAGQARAFARGTREFASSGSSRLKDQSGVEWDITESFLISKTRKEKLPRVPGRTSQWMSWVSFYPDSEVYTST